MIRTLDRARIDLVTMPISVRNPDGYDAWAVLGLYNAKGQSIDWSYMREGKSVNGFDNDVDHVKTEGVLTQDESCTFAWYPDFYRPDYISYGFFPWAPIDTGSQFYLKSLRAFHMWDYDLFCWELEFYGRYFPQWWRSIRRVYTYRMELNPTGPWDKRYLVYQDQEIFEYPTFVDYVTNNWVRSGTTSEVIATFSGAGVLTKTNTKYKSRPTYLSTTGKLQMDSYDLWLIANLQHPYFSEFSLNAAFQEACEGFEHLDMNNIDNVRQTVSGLNKLAQKAKLPKTKGVWKLASVFGSAANAWLWYRYSYSTTKQDIKEVYEDLGPTLARFNNAPNMGRYGAVTDQYGVEYRCEVVARDEVTDKLSTLSRKLSDLGFAPTFANLWDMVPWSFVVDWFLGVGDVLSAVDSSLKYKSTRFLYKRICFSRTCHWSCKAYPGITIRWYSRWGVSKPPIGIGWVKDDPSGKTTVKRELDAISLWVSSHL